MSAYLDLAEDRATRNIPTTMQDWSSRLDVILDRNDREILNDAGTISANVAKDLRLRKLRPSSLSPRLTPIG